MKKMSAFSILKGKKEKNGTLERNGTTRGSLKKASSTPAINGEEEKTSNKLLRAFKGGSFRSTIRGNKHRPSLLADGLGNSPFVAGDGAGVKLTAVKGKEKKDSNENLPPKMKMLPPDVTPQLPPRKKQKQVHLVTPQPAVSTQPEKQKKPLPPIPAADFTDTPKAPTFQPKAQSTPQLNITPKTATPPSKERKGSSSKKKGKRLRDQDSPETSVNKKKRVSSPPNARPENGLPLQKKLKSNKKRMSPTVMLEEMYNSQHEALSLFECMLNPVPADKFFREIWEKKPLLVTRHRANYNDGWFSSQELDTILHKEHIEFGVNLDVTSYVNGKRETHNPVGRAYRPVVWDFYQNGCSVRMLNPQTYSKNVLKMLSTLQEYFGCCVGANIYLTPPGTQGFAPHYDDIEAFILQLEGKKHWKLYDPRSIEETLPRVSSGNFTAEDIGDPILDVTLNAGDLLYFPRGTIHQGCTTEDAHSLHITVSCFQKNSWGDLLQTLMPRAVEIAMEEDVTFREGLPTGYLSYMGLVNSDVESEKRDAFLLKMNKLIQTMITKYLPADSACDQMGKKFIQDSLPPVVTEGEQSCSIHGHGEKWVASSNCVRGNTEIEADTMVKIIRKGCLRLLTEDDCVRIYHNLENARVYHGRDPQFIDITAELAPVVEMLIHSYPEYVSVDSLPASTLDEKVEMASVLYDKGLLVTGEPLESVHEDVDSESDDNT